MLDSQGVIVAAENVADGSSQIGAEMVLQTEFIFCATQPEEAICPLPAPSSPPRLL